ncbi:SDR family oxidoreductase [Microbacterium suwonense]|uniref:Nucleoside-diphosphate sugar epimerase n=1 Tax=Microbacterium suwonense TaxID=683047 RepID=A0ABN6X5P9_9MICO|nr:NAD(P)H-binding protein [Microbacterium suwonense]BDZ40042.1 nucleoside-diphosphate sugar epimerase [Microbacterium suwonense]
MRIVVAGGTGTVGRHTVQAAHDAGHEVVVLSRASGADVQTGSGLDAALDRADAVIDVTNIMSLSAKRARAFFENGTRHLLAAEERAGVGHHVALSIVGIDDIDASYYAGKLAQERAVSAGTVPFTIARVSQFHEFAGQLLSGTRGPFALIPRAPVRPVAAREVGAHLVRVAEQGPQGRATDLVGPRDEDLAELARRQLAFDGIRRRVVEIRLPGAYGRGLASGSLRGGADAEHARIDFDQWLHSEDHVRR